MNNYLDIILAPVITEKTATEKIPQDNKNEPVKKNYEKKNNTASKTVSLKSNK